LAKWSDHPRTQYGRQLNVLTTGPSLSIAFLVYFFPYGLKKTCRELIEPKLDDTQCGFCPGRRTTYQKFTPGWWQEWNLGSMPKTSTHGLLSSRKHTTGFLVKS